MIFTRYRRIVIAGLLGGLLCVSACDRSRRDSQVARGVPADRSSAAESNTPTPPQEVLPPRSPKPSPDSESVSPEPPADAVEADELHESEEPIDKPPSDEPSQSPQPPAQLEAPTQPEPPAAFRLFLPTSSGLLLVDVDLTIEGRSLSQAFEDQIDSVIREANVTGSPSWNELLEQVQGNPERFGPLAVASSGSRSLIDAYDRNRNGRADREEVVSFLFRDGRDHGPFRLVGSDAFRGVNRSESPIFQCVDSNSNQRLEPEEIELAEQSLRHLDRNGDQRIDWAEIDALLGTRTDNPWDARRARRWGNVAMDLSGYVDWSMLSYSLEGIPDQGVFRDGDSALASLDRNGSQSIDEQEAKGLLETDADLRLTIQFDARAISPPQIAVKLRNGNPTNVPVLSDSGSSARIVTDNLILIVRASDLIRRNNFAIDAFTQLDSDQDGALAEAEIPAAVLRDRSFEELDQNDDGKLTVDELQNGMQQSLPIWALQVRGRGAESPDALFTWLDKDQDGSLSARELNHCEPQLRERNSDTGVVVPQDIPDAFVVQFGRGNPQQDDAIFTLDSPRQATAPTRPRWAESMDRNQDGDISRAEFLGSSQQFDELDQNGDQFLAPDELP